MINAQEKANALEWLFAHGNPIVRLWAAQLLGAPDHEIERLRAEMLQHPVVQYWINCLLVVAEKPAIHNSFDTCLENAMRKVLLFGVRERDDPRLPAFNDGALQHLRRTLEHPNWLNPVEYTILASYLAAMGRDDPAVAATIQERLNSAHTFAAAGDYDYHTDPAGYPTIPAARRGHPLVHPRFYPGNKYLYPLVYDVFAWANMPNELDTPENRAKIDTILHYVLDKHYQRLPWGYGLILVPPNKYYGMGWSVHVPRFFESDNRVPDSGSVWWADALAPHPVAARSDWFRRMLEHLDGFRTADGLWKVPAAYLAEAPNKYFVGGGYMGLGESRKDRDALKIESTAWMMRIYDKL